MRGRAHSRDEGGFGRVVAASAVLLALLSGIVVMMLGAVGHMARMTSPGLANLRGVGRLLGSPAFPITPTFPFLGLAGFLPLPVKFHLHFGEPLHFEGDPGDEDAQIEKKVDVVKDAIRGLIKEGRAARTGWFR